MGGNLSIMPPRDEPNAMTLGELIALVAGAAFAMALGPWWPHQQFYGGMDDPEPTPRWFLQVDDALGCSCKPGRRSHPRSRCD